MADETISPEEYERWLTPPQALTYLEREMNHATAVAEIVSRIHRGLVKAVAKTTTVEANGRSERSDFSTLLPRAWPRDGINLLVHRFWMTGTFGQTISYGSPHQRIFHFFGVRFSPDDIAEIRLASLRDLPPSSSPLSAPLPISTPDERKPLPSAERQRFAQLYVEVFGDTATETKAHQAAVACYPDYKVSRDPFLADFRAYRGKQPPGRKRQTGE